MKYLSKDENSRLICFTHFRSTDGHHLPKAFSLGSGGAIKQISRPQVSGGIALKVSLQGGIAELTQDAIALEINDSIDIGMLSEPEVETIPEGFRDAG